MMDATFVLALAARDLRLSLPPGHTFVLKAMVSLRVHGGLPSTVRAAG